EEDGVVVVEDQIDIAEFEQAKRQAVEKLALQNHDVGGSGAAQQLQATGANRQVVALPAEVLKIIPVLKNPVAGGCRIAPLGNKQDAALAPRRVHGALRPRAITCLAKSSPSRRNRG